MAQKQSPWLEAAYGWNYGESGWNSGMDSNLLKFSVMFDRNVDSITATLPPALNGQVHYNTADNRIYFAVDTLYYSTSVPKWFTIQERVTGNVWQFNGTNLVEAASLSDLDTRLDSVEVTISTLGSAAFEDATAFASQAEVDTVGEESKDYTDALRTDLANSTDAQKGAKLVAGAVRHINSIASLRTLAGQYDGEVVYLRGRLDNDSIGSGIFRWNASSTQTDNDGTIVGSATTGRWLRYYTDTVETDWFGVSKIGANTTTAILNALSVSANKKLNFSGDATSVYFCAAELDVPQGCRINLNRGTLQFFRTGQTFLFTINSVSGVEISNGVIQNTGGALGLSMDGYRQTIRGYNISNCSFHDLRFEHGIGVVPAIAVYGNTYNIDVYNITTGRPSGFAIVNTIFISHWWWDVPAYDRSDAGYVAGRTTNHPRNIRIRGVYSPYRHPQGFWFSSSYNVLLENVDIQAEEGAFIYPGDYGQDYSNPEFVGKVSKNIIMRNVSFTNGLQQGIRITANGASTDLGACVPVPCRSIIENARLIGGPDIVSSFGMFFSGVVDTQVIGGRISGWQYGVSLGTAAEGVSLRGVEIDNNVDRGISIVSSTTACRRILVEKCWLHNNNTANNALNTSSHIYGSNFTEGQIRDNLFGPYSGTETAYASTYFATTSGPVTNVSVENNHTTAVRSSQNIAHLVSTTPAYGILYGLRGNTSNTTNVDNGFGIQSRGFGKRVMLLDASSGFPTAGSWVVGDEILYRSPSVNGYRGAVCTVAGTPGTWQNYGAINLSSSTTYDPPSLVDGAGVTTTVTVTGAALGDFAMSSFSNSTQGLTVTADVTATNTVSVRFQNETGATLDLASGTLYVKVMKP